MDWISNFASSAYLWLAGTPLFLQVATGVLLALVVRDVIRRTVYSSKATEMRFNAKLAEALGVGVDSIHHELSALREDFDCLPDDISSMKDDIRNIELDVHNMEARINPSHTSPDFNPPQGPKG
tara:strand:+ start:4992 stop:5363 length:372 start_codon:yes stop_codon:yes gene_type:complete